MKGSARGKLRVLKDTGRQTDLHLELVKQATRGSEAAMTQLYDLYARAMLNTAHRIVNSREEAEDVVQEAFLAAFRRLDRFKQESSFGAWLKRIVINKSLNQLKKRKEELFDTLESVSEPETVSGDEFESPVSLDMAYEALHELPTGYRTVLSLYLLEGYDHEEIAQILGVSVSTSLSQYSRAKSKLRLLLTKRVEDGQARRVVSQ